MKLQLASVIFALASSMVDAGGIRKKGTRRATGKWKPVHRKPAHKPNKLYEKKVSMMGFKDGGDLCFPKQSFCETYASPKDLDIYFDFGDGAVAAAIAATVSDALCKSVDKALALWVACFKVDGTFKVVKDWDGDASKIHLDTSLFTGTAAFVEAAAFAGALAEAGSLAAVADLAAFCDAGPVVQTGSLSWIYEFFCVGAGGGAFAVGDAFAASVGATYAEAGSGAGAGTSTVVSVKGDNIKYFEAAVGATAFSFSFADTGAIAGAFAEAFVAAVAASFVALCEISVEKSLKGKDIDIECDKLLDAAIDWADSNAVAFAAAAATAFAAVAFEVNAVAKYEHGKISFDHDGLEDLVGDADAQAYCLNEVVA